MDHWSTDTDLALVLVPVKHHRREGVGCELLTLCSVVVGVEHDGSAIGLDVLAQDDPRIGEPVLVERRDRHRVGIGGDPLVPCLIEPRLEDRERGFRERVREAFALVVELDSVGCRVGVHNLGYPQSAQSIGNYPDQAVGYTRDSIPQH